MKRILAVLLHLSIPIAALAAPAASPFLLRYGAIADSSRGAVYTAHPSGGVDSIDLAGGRTLWTAPDAAVPLGADDAFVVAQAEEKPVATERFQLVILNAATGAKTGAATVTLPAGAHALVNDDKDEKFRATAEREGSHFLVSWLYTEFLVEGIRPKPGEPTIRYVAGSVRISTDGKLLGAEGAPAADVPARWKTFASPPQAPWHAGAVLAHTEGGRGSTLTLQRSEAASGRALPEQVLSRRGLVAVPSADQQHVLASERVGQGGADDPEYRWLIFTNETGDRVTELRRDVSAAPFFVFSDSVIYESRPHGYVRGDLRVDEPLELQSVRLTTGVPKWKVEIRDLSYRGPRPSAR